MSSIAVSSPASRNFAGLGLVAVALMFVYAPTAVWLYDRWTMSVWHNAHGMVIPPVVAYLVWNELRGLRHLPVSASALGFVILVPALALHALDAGMGTQLLSAASIVLALPGLALLFLGVERTKAIAFPLAFTVFMLPIPLAFTESMHLALRQVATAASSVLIPLAGVPVYAEQTTLHLPNVTLLVADACSGFSTLYAAIAVAFLTAYSCRSAWRRALVLFAAAPIAIAANILRVTLLALLVYWQGSEVLATKLHVVSGLFTFALALPVIFWIGGGTSTERSPNGYGTPPKDGSGEGAMLSPRYAPAAILALAITAVPTITHSYVGAQKDDGRTTAAIPATLAGFSSTPTGRRASWAQDVYASDDWIERKYRSTGGQELLLFVARSFDAKRLYHHPELGVTHGTDFRSGGTASLPGRQEVPVHVLKAPRGNGLAVYALHQDDRFVGNPVFFQLRTAGALLFSPRKPMTLFFVHDPAAPADVTLEHAAATRLLREAIDSFVAQSGT